MNLSKHDKNIVSLLMIAEVLTKSIIDECDKLLESAPPDKVQDYMVILHDVEPLHKSLIALNDEISDDVHKVLGEAETDLLVDSVLSICVLLEEQSPKQINKVLKAAGIRSADIVESFFKEPKKVLDKNTDSINIESNKQEVS